MTNKKKFNSDQAVSRLIEIANENGYSLIFNGSEDNDIRIVAYPFRGTLCSQEELARQLYETMEEMGVTKEGVLNQFRNDVAPDDLDEFVFDNPTREGNIHVSVFHNKYILLKQIVLKL